MKNLKVSTKLLTGFGIVAAFTLIVGSLSIVDPVRYRTAIILFLILSVGVSIFLGFYISGLIGKPLNAAINVIAEMGKGHLSGRLNLGRKDEIGVLAKSIDKLSEDLQILHIGTLNRISDGELTVELPSKDGKDEFGAALRRIVNPLRELIIEDGGRVLRSAARKDLSRRLTGNYKGDFARMKNNINAALENIDDTLTHVAAAVEQVSGASYEIVNESQSLADKSIHQARTFDEAASSLGLIAAAEELNERSAELSNIVEGFKLSGEAERYYVDRSAAEVWVDVESADQELSVLPAVATVSATPAAISAYKRRQRRRRQMEAHRAEKAYKQKRQLRAAAQDTVRENKRKRRQHKLSVRAVRARELLVNV